MNFEDIKNYIFFLIKNINFLLSKIFNITILTLDSNDIKISNIIFSSLILIFGYYFFHLSQKNILSYISKNIEKDQNAVLLLRKVYSFIYILILIPIILQVANIPLKTFAFVGGALAIGVGYGAQNIVSNVISGIILILEKPIKIGDKIKIDNIFGTVIFIGGRSTVLKSLDDSTYLIPNNEMVQKYIQNFGKKNAYSLDLEIKFTKDLSIYNNEDILSKLSDIFLEVSTKYKIISSSSFISEISETKKIFLAKIDIIDVNHQDVKDIKNLIGIMITRFFKEINFELRYI